MDGTLQIIIRAQDIPDFYRMLLDNKRERGNTFVYLLREFEARYPTLKEHFSDE